MAIHTQTAFAQGKNQICRIISAPKMRWCSRQLGWGGLSFLTVGIRLWALPMPVFPALILFVPAAVLPAVCAGAAIGCLMRFPGLGAMWFSAGLLLRSFPPGNRQQLPMYLGAVTAAAAFCIPSQAVPAVRFGISALQGFTAAMILLLLNRLPKLLSLGLLGIMGAGCMHRGLALLLWGFGTVLPVQIPLLWGGVLELLTSGSVPLLSVLALSVPMQALPLSPRLRRWAAPSLGALSAMLLLRRWDPWLALCVPLGAAFGMTLPKQLLFLSKTQGTAGAQVRLEQMSLLLNRLQRSLLELPAPIIDRDALADLVRSHACGACPEASVCANIKDVNVSLLTDSHSFRCLHTARVLRELQAAATQEKQLQLLHSQTAELRTALMQQYGYLSGWMQLLSDRLSQQRPRIQAHYRAQISARSRQKSLENADRCLAFPGEDGICFVVLCDGMGTGLGASAAAQETAGLLKELLRSGLPAQYAMGCIHSLLALRSQAGLVTLDLCEIRLDTGKVTLFKWGAPPSLLIHRCQALPLGSPSPPPGISLTEQHEAVHHADLSNGDLLVMTTDGITLAPGDLPEALAGITQPAMLAERLIAHSADGKDDATAAVIRLRRNADETKPP